MNETVNSEDSLLSAADMYVLLLGHSLKPAIRVYLFAILGLTRLLAWFVYLWVLNLPGCLLLHIQNKLYKKDKRRGK